MSNKNSCYAVVEQENPGKYPIMGEGDLNAKNAHQYDNYCNSYFDEISLKTSRCGRLSQGFMTNE